MRKLFSRETRKYFLARRENIFSRDEPIFSPETSQYFLARRAIIFSLDEEIIFSWDEEVFSHETRKYFLMDVNPRLQGTILGLGQAFFRIRNLSVRLQSGLPNRVYFTGIVADRHPQNTWGGKCDHLVQFRLIEVGYTFSFVFFFSYTILLGPETVCRLDICRQELPQRVHGQGSSHFCIQKF